MFHFCTLAEFLLDQHRQRRLAAFLAQDRGWFYYRVGCISNQALPCPNLGVFYIYNHNALLCSLLSAGLRAWRRVLCLLVTLSLLLRFQDPLGFLGLAGGVDRHRLAFVPTDFPSYTLQTLYE